MNHASQISTWDGPTNEVTSPRRRAKLSPVPDYDAHFGGPDQPVGRLRDLLAEHIEGVPAGGSIDWITYYFRDWLSSYCRPIVGT